MINTHLPNWLPANWLPVNWLPTAALVGLLLLGAMALPARAQTNGAQENQEQQVRQLLEKRDRQIKQILGTRQTFTDAQREKLKTLVNGLIDFRAMSRATLGQYWNDLTAEQQREFVEVFSAIVREQSLSDLEPYRSPITYQEITVEDSTAYVKTTSVHEGERIPVAYDLLRTDGQWRARDIIVDEVGTVEGYQRSFQTKIRKDGYDALMKSLRNKLEEINGS